MKWIIPLVSTLVLVSLITVQGQDDTPETNRNFIIQHEVLSFSAFFVIVIVVWLRRRRFQSQ
ncbi:MAG: hypothetical protein D6732_23040 [Methanobacteriota archaeon]|nr:MAG: hypothetical protein D6732_23040 [Euryarchaeota archaeon]